VPVAMARCTLYKALRECYNLCMSALPEKLCIKCKATKPVGDFGKDRRRTDGLFPYCKRCRLRDPSKYEERDAYESLGLHRCSRCQQWLSRDEFYVNESHRNGLHNWCKGCSVSSASSYGKANRGTIVIKERSRHEANPLKRQAKWRRFYDANVDRLTLKAHQNRREYDPALDTLTGPEWRQIIRCQGGLCKICRVKFNAKVYPTRDHILPLSKGGYLTKDNTQALCRPCNTRKGNRVDPGTQHSLFDRLTG